MLPVMGVGVPVGGLIHKGSGSVVVWLAVGLWGGLPRSWWVFGPYW